MQSILQSLCSIVIPDSAEPFGNDEFDGCRISSFKNIKSLISFGENPFTKFKKLEIIDGTENPNFVFIDRVLMEDEIDRPIFCIPLKSGTPLFQTQ